MTIQVSGFVEANRTIAAIEKKVTETEMATLAIAARQGAAIIERAAKLNIQGRHPVGTPRPNSESGPKTLMNVTGALRASIKSSEPKRIGFGTYVVQVGPTLIYGRVQELGGGSNIPARPYMEPAMQDSREEIYKVYQEVWKRSVG